MDAGVCVYDKEVFSVPTRNAGKGYARHHGSHLWDAGKSSSWGKRMVRRLVGDARYFQWVSWKIARINEFGPVYRAHKREPVPRPQEIRESQK